MYNYDGDEHAQPIVQREGVNHFEELRASILANARAGTLTNKEIQQLQDMLTPAITNPPAARVGHAPLDLELSPMGSEESVNISGETIQPVLHNDASTIEMGDMDDFPIALSGNSIEIMTTHDDVDKGMPDEASVIGIRSLAEPSNMAIA